MTGAAADDFKALKAGEDASEYQVVGAVVMNRDASGKVDVQEHDSGAHVAGGAVLGGTAGLVVGLFAPPLLAATAVGAGIGAVVGKLSKKHQEKQLGVELEEYLPPGSSAVVAVVDDVYADKVEAALVNSDKRINKAIDKGDYDELQQAISESADEVSDAITSLSKLVHGVRRAGVRALPPHAGHRPGPAIPSALISNPLDS